MNHADSPAPAPGELTLLLQRIEQGDAAAAGELVPLVYEDLRRLAAAKLAREKAGHTLQPTALVHEMWLRLGGDRQPAWRSRAHFFGAAAEAMRRILIDNARRRRALRHGGDQEFLPADDSLLALAAPDDPDQFLALNEALDALAAVDPRKADLVKQWYIVGLSVAECAELHGISERTAKRDLAYARAWLFGALRESHD